MRSKHDRRIYYRSLQESFTAEQYQLWNAALAAPLMKMIDVLPKGSLVAAYQAKVKEAQLQPLFHLPYRFCFPRVTSKEKARMEFRYVKNPSNINAFSLGSYGILEPKEKDFLVEKSDIKLCLVPLLAFDQEGRRLGQGKGFYDRFLSGFKGVKVGVGFEWQYSPQTLPFDENDQALDIVITEHLVREFRPN